MREVEPVEVDVRLRARAGGVTIVKQNFLSQFYIIQVVIHSSTDKDGESPSEKFQSILQMTLNNKYAYCKNCK